MFIKTKYYGWEIYKDKNNKYEVMCEDLLCHLINPKSNDKYFDTKEEALEELDNEMRRDGRWVK